MLKARVASPRLSLHSTSAQLRSVVPTTAISHCLKSLPKTRLLSKDNSGKQSLRDSRPAQLIRNVLIERIQQVLSTSSWRAYAVTLCLHCCAVLRMKRNLGLAQPLLLLASLVAVALGPVALASMPMHQATSADMPPMGAVADDAPGVHSLFPHPDGR